MRQKALRKQQSLEALQEYRLQELKEALIQEDKPDAIVIHKYTKKVVQRGGPRRYNQFGSVFAHEEVPNNSETPIEDQDLNRASKFRGVSKNGLQWQVCSIIIYLNNIGSTRQYISEKICRLFLLRGVGCSAL